MKSVLANHIVFFQAFLDMGEEALVDGAEECIVAEEAVRYDVEGTAIYLIASWAYVVSFVCILLNVFIRL